VRVFSLCFAVGLVLTASEARADLSFTLDASNVTGYTTGTFGTITLTDGTGSGLGENGIAVGTVQVNETLAPNVFANTGAAYSLEFTLTGAPSITTSDITNLQFTGPNTPPTSTSYSLYTNPTVPHGNGYSGFGLAIDCGSCGTGTSPPQYNSLVFDITDSSNALSSTVFTTNTGGSYYFLSDIGIYVNSTSYSTGYATADTPTTISGNSGNASIPEPASIALLGGAMLAMGILRRRRSAC